MKLIHARFPIPALLLVLIAFAGCKREPEVAPYVPQPLSTVDLQLAMVFLHGAHQYELSSTYTDEFGTLFKLDTLRFLLSNTSVSDDEGVTVGSYPQEMILVDAQASVDTFELGTLNAVHIHLISWTLGLETALNHQDPASASAPLDQQSLRCGPAASDGYAFLEVEGRWDSDGDGAIGATDAVFVYKVCGDEFARPAASHVHIDLPTSGPMLVPVSIDVADVLAGVDIANHATADATLAELLMTNLVVSLATTH